jgi:hypothetical protein
MFAGVSQHGRLEEFSPSIEAAHHRAQRYFENLCNLLVGKTLQIGQQDCHPVVFREIVYRSFHILIEDVLQQLLLRALHPAGDFVADLTLEAVFYLGEIALRRLLLPFPVAVDESILEYLEQPSLEVGAFFELVVVLIGL